MLPVDGIFGFGCNEIVPAPPKKLVVNNMYTCPAMALVISTNSTFDPEKEQSIGAAGFNIGQPAATLVNGPYNAKSISPV